MKIDMNFEKINSSNFNQENVLHVKKEMKPESSIYDETPQMIQNLSRKKAIIDALIITQIAQDYFQKAVVISSKLKNIVNENDSDILKGNELNNALNDIKSSLKNIHDNNQDSEFFTKIDKDINELEQFYNTIMSFDNKPDLKKIDRIAENFSNITVEIDQSLSKLKAEFSSANIKRSDENINELSQHTVNWIINNPQNSLKSQGNINHEIAKQLL